MNIKKGPLNIPMPRQPSPVAFVERASPLIEKRVTWMKVLAGSLLLSYLLRITIPAVWLTPISPYAVNFGGYFVLLAALVFFFVGNLRMNAVAMFMMGCVIVTILFSTDIGVAGTKGFLWVLLFAVVGPLIESMKVRAFRDLLWHWHKSALFFIVAVSFTWVVAGLPQYGKGVSGVTLHCMLLGPFAALAFIYATVKTLDTRSFKYGLIAGVSLLACLVSGSRSASIGAVAAVVLIPILRIKSQVLRWICVIFLLVTTFFVWSAFDFGSLDGSPVFRSENTFERYVAELQQKGLENTRKQLWVRRWAEFESSPFLGIGIGVETFGGATTEYGTIVVEPGSSYLAILSMTGIIGALSVLTLLGTLAMKFRKKWAFLNSTDKVEVISAGIFWAVHAVAEGWIFAGGSILCLFFWLWVSRLSDLGSMPLTRSEIA